MRAQTRLKALALVSVFCAARGWLTAISTARQHCMRMSAVASTTSDAASKTTDLSTSRSKLVVLTREAGKNDKLRDRLHKLQVETLELPCIAHCHAEGYPELAPTLDHQPFDYVVVTSPEAAHVFLEVCKTCTTYKPVNIVSIGDATSALLEKEGAQVAFSPSKALAKVLVQELPPVSEDRATRVLYPASKRAARTLEDGLSSRGFEVTRLNTYDTVPAGWSKEEKDLAASCEVVTFASPSALKVWTSRLGTGYKVACIGETTATAAREQGWNEKDIYYPGNPGVEGWANSVVEALQAAGHDGASKNDPE